MMIDSARRCYGLGTKSRSTRWVPYEPGMKGETAVLVYIEYISRRPGVALDVFHEVAGRGQTRWAQEYSADQLILTLGRTWRIGPEPEYLHIWYNAHAGIERIDDWERIFASGAVDSFEVPFRLAARIEAAGCYEALLDPVPGGGGPYYAEYFDVAPGASAHDVRALFQERAGRHVAFTLNLLVDRIGMLGPAPRGLAIWSLPAFGALATIARDLDGAMSPIQGVSAALYANFGHEIL